MKNELKFAAGVAGVLIILIVGFVMKFGVNPRPIVLMSPSQFNSAAEMGQGLYKALWKQLQQREVMVIGLDKQDPEIQEIWKSFVEAHDKDSTTPVKRALLDQFSERFPNQPTWFQVGELDGFHGKNDPPIKLAEDRWKRFASTLIITRALSPDASCELEIGSVESYRKLDCLKIFGARQIAMSKKVEKNKFRAVLNQPGTADLVFVYQRPE